MVLPGPGVISDQSRKVEQIKADFEAMRDAIEVLQQGGAGLGTVTSVGMAGDGVFLNSAVPGSPVTGNGTLAPTTKIQLANTVPVGTGTGVVWRTLTVSDLPASVVTDTSTHTLSNKQINANQLTGSIAAARLPAIDLAASGAGGITGLLDFDHLAQEGAQNGDVIKWNGTHWAPAADGGGSGSVAAVVGTANFITVDSTDPANPIINIGSKVVTTDGAQTLTNKLIAASQLTGSIAAARLPAIDLSATGAGGVTNKLPPASIDTTGASSGNVLKFNGTAWAPGTDATAGGGGGTVNSIVGTTNLVTVDSTDPANPIVNVGSKVVTTDGAQTLTNKDIDAAQLSGTINNARLAASVVLTTAVQTLTNKIIGIAQLLYTALGDLPYGGVSGAGARLAGNTTTTKKFLTQTGDGTNSAAPGWNVIAGADVPAINLAASGAGGVTGNLPAAQVNGNPSASQPLDSTLTALAAFTSVGIMTQTVADTFAARTLTGTSNRIAVTNGDGVSGNPTFDIGSDVVTLTASQTITNKSIDASQLTGTIADARHSANVALVNNANNWSVSQLPSAAGSKDLGSTTRNWRDLFLGGASNYARFVVATLTGNRTVNIPDADSTTVVADTGSANNFLTAISATGAVSKAQPAFSNLSGSITTAQMPTLASARLFVGNVSNVPTAVDITGDVTISNAGVTAIKSSVALAGVPTVPTASAGTNTTQIASTAFVTAAVAAGGGGGGLSTTLADGKIYIGNVSNVATAVTLTGDVTTSNAGVTAIKSSVALAGNPTTTTQTAGDNTTKIATTAFVTTAVAAGGGGGSYNGTGMQATSTELRISWGVKLNNAGGTILGAYGVSAPSISGTPTNADDSDGIWTNIASAASSNSDAIGVIPNGLTRRSKKPRAWINIKIVDTAVLRFFFGFFPYGFDPHGADTLLNTMGFRYNPATDTNGNIRFYTADASGTANVIDTGVPFVAGPMLLCVDGSNPASIKGYINGTLVATSTSNVHDNSGSGYFGGPQYGVRTLAAVAKNIKIGGVFGDVIC